MKGIKIPPSGALVEGRCYHKSLQVNFEQKVSTLQDLPLDDCLDAFSTEWREAISEYGEVNWEGSRPEDIKNEGCSLVRAYMTSVAPAVQPSLVEEWYVLDVAGVTFVMRIDLIDAEGTVIDHKTSSRAYSQAEVDRDMQASAAAFSLSRPIIFEYHVAIKYTEPKIRPVRTVRTREDIEWWLDAVTGIITQMKTGVAPPRSNGWHCSPEYCGYWSMCRGSLTRSYF